MLLGVSAPVPVVSDTKMSFGNSYKPVFNWANICFANLVRAFGRTATKLCSVPKSFAQHFLGIAQFGEPCLWLAESKESSPVDERENKKKEKKQTDDVVGGVALSLGPRMIQQLLELHCEGWLKYTDLTLAYILDHAVFCLKFGPKFAPHYNHGLWEEGESVQCLKQICILHTQ